MAEDQSREHDEQQRVQRAEQSTAAGPEGSLAPENAPAYPTSLLSDPTLNGRGNGPVRTALMLQMQRTYGNRATQRFLKGDTKGVAQRQPAVSPNVQRGPDKAATLEADKDAITITFGSNAVSSAVSAYSLGVLKDILKAAGLKSATITSTARTPTDQARAMFDNLEGKGKGQGVAAQKALYGPAGDKVIDVYVQQKAKKKSADEIKAAMKDKIIDIGPSKVSRHCGDPEKLNVFDVGPNSIVGGDKAQAAFKKAAFAEVGKRVSNFIPYPKDPGHHFEIAPK